MADPNIGSPTLAETVSYLMIPILIVATGLLFLADYYHGWALGDTWPSLLIVGGLLKVLEYAVGKGG